MNMVGSVKDILINMDLELIPIDITTILTSGIAIIRELPSSPEEIALAVNIEGVGAAIIDGCSHPGAENIVDKSIQDLGISPYLVIGGFHLWLDTVSFAENTVLELLDLGVKKICPIHCSGNLIREYIQENYPGNYVEGCVGTT